MRAAVYHGRRDVRVEDVAEPGEPGPGELRLEVLRAAICGTDAGEWAHGPTMTALDARHPASGHLGPVVIGHEFVGAVTAVGDGVEGLAPGDRVVSGAGVSCGECAWCAAGRTNLCASYFTLGFHAHGGLAEAVLTPAAICHPVPEAASDEAAAIAQPLAVAIHALARADVRSGELVAVVGAGGIGSQIVAAGAGIGARVVAADIDEGRLRTAERLGAIAVVNVSDERLEGVVAELGEPEGARVVIEASGSAAGLATALRAVRRGGNVVALGLPAAPPEIDLVDAVLREVDIVTTVAHVCDTDLPRALELLADPALAEKAIERLIPIGDVVGAGLVPLTEGRATGKIVVDVRG